MDHFALRAALAGQLDAAALIAGYVDGTHRRREAERDPNETRARDRLHALLRDGIFAAKLNELLARGADMHENDVLRLVLDS